MSSSQDGKQSKQQLQSPVSVEMQLEQIQRLRERNPQTALVLCEQILHQINSTSPHWTLAQLTYAYVLISVGRLQDALNICHRLSKTIEHTHDSRLRSLYLTVSGIANAYTGNFITAQERFQQLLDQARRISNLRDECRACINLGWVHTSLEDFPTALAFYSRALSLSQQLHLDSAQAVTLENMGIIYRAIGNVDLALDNYRQAYELRRQGGYSAGMAQSMLNIAVVYSHKGQHREALALVREARKLAQQCNERRVESYCLALMGRVYRELGNLRRSLQITRTALRMRQQADYKPELCISYADLGEVYFQLGSYTRCRHCLDQAYALALAIDEPGILTTVSEKLYLLAKHQHRWEQALHWLELHHKWYVVTAERRKEDESSRQMMIETIAKVSRNHEDYRRYIAELEKLVEDQRREIRRLIFEATERTTTSEHELHTSEPLAAVRELMTEAEHQRQSTGWLEHVLRRMELVLPGFVQTVAGRFPSLSSMELLICTLLRLQLRSKEIADLLGLTTKTVNRHRESIRAKCGLGRRVNLVTYLCSIA